MLDDVSSVQSLRIERISVSSEETLTTAHDTEVESLPSEAVIPLTEPGAIETYRESRQPDGYIDETQISTELTSAHIEPSVQAFTRISASDSSQQHNGNVYNVTYNITYNIQLPNNEPDALTQVVLRLHFPGGGSPTQEVVTNPIDDTSRQRDRA